MANVFKGEATVKAIGQTFTLVIDFNALADFEDVSGKNGLAFLESPEKNLSDIRSLVWAALREHHPEADLRLAGKILSEAPDALTKALESMAPELGDTPAGNARTGRKAR